MKRGIYVTITEIGRFYGKSPFKAGEIVKISKDTGNGRRKYDIKATLPLLGTLGYLATSSGNIAGGTIGAEKIYGKIRGFAYAQIMFVTDYAIIAKVLLPKEVERTPYLKPYRKKRKEKAKKPVKRI